MQVESLGPLGKKNGEQRGRRGSTCWWAPGPLTSQLIASIRGESEGGENRPPRKLGQADIGRFCVLPFRPFWLLFQRVE